jgi:hypothetical protein
MSELVQGMVSVALAIVGIAIIATLVSRQAQTPAVIKALSGGFADDIRAAVSPVTGGGVGIGSYSSSSDFFH